MMYICQGQTQRERYITISHCWFLLLYHKFEGGYGKMNRKIVCFILALFLVPTLGGCKQYEGPYTFFRQEHGNVEKIEICAYDHKNNRTRTPVAILTHEQEESLLADLATLQCKQYLPGDHTRSYGRFQVCITYADGELELIGPNNIGYVTAEGVGCLTNYYPASEQELWNIIAKYVDSDALTKLK